MANLKKIGQHQSVSYRLVDPTELSLDPDNQRIYDAQDPDNIALRKSLMDEGVLTALDIYEDGMVDNGNRRLFNIKILMDEGKWTHGLVPSIIVERPANAVEATVRRLNKNEARQFSALEQGMAFASLRDGGLNNSQIAARTPFTSMHIGNMMTLHDSAQEVREAVQARRMSATLAVATIRKHGEETLMAAISLATSEGRERATERHIDAIVAADADQTPVDAVEIDAEVEVEVSTDAVTTDDETTGETVTTDDETTDETTDETVTTDDETTDETVITGAPFDLDDTAPAAPVVADEEEVQTSTPGTSSSTDTTAPNKGVGMAPKALLAAILPVIADLEVVARSGTKAEKLEALKTVYEDLTSFLANAKKMGLSV
jgi:hypothetical protein